jgi:hypothetical protein
VGRCSGQAETGSDASRRGAEGSWLNPARNKPAAHLGMRCSARQEYASRRRGCRVDCPCGVGRWRWLAPKATVQGWSAGAVFRRQYRHAKPYGPFRGNQPKECGSQLSSTLRRPGRAQPRNSMQCQLLLGLLRGVGNWTFQQPQVSARTGHGTTAEQQECVPQKTRAAV